MLGNLSMIFKFCQNFAQKILGDPKHSVPSDVQARSSSPGCKPNLERQRRRTNALRDRLALRQLPKPFVRTSMGFEGQLTVRTNAVKIQLIHAIRRSQRKTLDSENMESNQIDFSICTYASSLFDNMTRNLGSISLYRNIP